MIEMNIPYTDFNNNKVTEKFSFHLSLAELADIELTDPRGFEGRYREMIKKNDGGGILGLLKELMILSVGRRSEDGRRFMKTDEIREDFEQSGAYSALLVQLATEEVDPAKFFSGVIPSDIHEVAERVKNQTKTSNDDLPRQKEISEYTLPELLDMSDEEFKSLALRGKNNLPQSFLVAGMQRATR